MKKYAGVCVQDVGLFLTIGFDGKNYFLVAGSKLAPDEVESLREAGCCLPDEPNGFRSIWLLDAERALGTQARNAHLDRIPDAELSRLSECLKPAKHYLLYGEGMTWNGHDRYKIVDDLSEVSDTIVDYNGRCLELCESSHDVPTDAPFYVIGIGEQTKRTLEDSDPQVVRQFVEKTLTIPHD